MRLIEEVDKKTDNVQQDGISHHAGKQPLGDELRSEGGKHNQQRKEIHRKA